MVNKRKKSKFQKQLITHHRVKQRILEQYDALRATIGFINSKNEIKTIACTSANSDEGKGAVISNLGLTLARENKKILLLDADLRNPSLHLFFGLENNVGISDLLQERCFLKDLVLQTSLNNLFILTAGEEVANSFELLSSDLMKRLLEEASLSFDIILVNVSPILETADGLIGGSICEHVLFVVKKGSTTKTDLQESMILLEKAQIRLIGTVLADRN